MKKTVHTLVAVILILTLLFTFSGCGGLKTVEAEITVKNMLDAFKAQDFKRAENYVDMDDITMEGFNEDTEQVVEFIMNYLFDKIGYEIISSEQIDDDTVKVTTKITVVKLEPVLTEFLTYSMQLALNSSINAQSALELEKKITDKFIEISERNNLETITEEVPITVEKNDDGWEVEPDGYFTDVILGGLTDAANSLQNLIQ